LRGIFQEPAAEENSGDVPKGFSGGPDLASSPPATPGRKQGWLRPPVGAAAPWGRPHHAAVDLMEAIDQAITRRALHRMTSSSWPP